MSLAFDLWQPTAVHMLMLLRIAAPHGSDHLAFVQRGARQQAPLDMVSQVEILRVTILWHMLLLP